MKFLEVPLGGGHFRHVLKRQRGFIVDRHTRRVFLDRHGKPRASNLGFTHLPHTPRRRDPTPERTPYPGTNGTGTGKTGQQYQP